MKKTGNLRKKLSNAKPAYGERAVRICGREVSVKPRLLLVLILFLGIVGFGSASIAISPVPSFAASWDNVTAEPDTTLASIQVMPIEGPVGSKVFVKILNHQANKQVIVLFGKDRKIGPGTIVASKVTTDGSGYAVAEFLIDIWPAYPYIITSDDGTNFRSGTFRVIPSITTGEQVAGMVGDTVVVNGNGFAAKKLVSLYFDDVKYASSETDEKGRFYDLKLTVPPATRGNHIIKAQDTENNAANVSYNVKQHINVIPTSAAVGDNITIMGNGFQGITDVVIYLDDRDFGIVQTGTNGDFITNIRMPPSGDGVHTLKVDDKVNKAFKSVTITSALTVSPPTGYIGLLAGLQGTGFRPGFPVNITYDNIKMDGTTVNILGGFSLSFKIPVSKSGPHSVNVTDGINTRSAVFTVESTPPVAPTATLPVDGTRLPKDVHFEWSVVSDASGVTYTLEIADDPSFANVIMSQANILANYIDITEDSKMLTGRDRAYYWRIKAVDRASNESLWSPVNSFYKGHNIFTIINNMPDWVRWTLIALGIILFGALFFWVGITIKRLRQLNEEDEEYEDAGYGGNP